MSAPHLRPQAGRPDRRLEKLCPAIRSLVLAFRGTEMLARREIEALHKCAQAKETATCGLGCEQHVALLLGRSN